VGQGQRGRAAILTGERGSGKTTLCLELARGRPELVGIVSPAILDASGNKVGFSALCLQTGEQWELGRSDIELDGPHYGKYSFSAEGFTRAIRCLQDALELRGRIVVLDEIGPLEMELHGGFTPALPLLEKAGRLLVVTRPSYGAFVIARLTCHACAEIRLDAWNRRDAAVGILECVGDV
jgi:nucleoside-triphosphatase THEP1